MSESGFIPDGTARRAMDALRESVLAQLQQAYERDMAYYASLPPTPPPSLWFRLKQATYQRWWNLRWGLAEKIAGEPVHGQGECPDW